MDLCSYVPTQCAVYNQCPYTDETCRDIVDSNDTECIFSSNSVLNQVTMEFLKFGLLESNIPEGTGKRYIYDFTTIVLHLVYLICTTS